MNIRQNKAQKTCTNYSTNKIYFHKVIMKNTKINAIITAGGSSQRYGSKNKLFEKCGSSCVLIEAIKPFLEIPSITKIVVGIETSFADEFAAWLELAGLSEDNRIVLSIGGSSRTQTVKNALVAIDDDAELVLVHDGARPYVSKELIKNVIDSANINGVALPLLPLTDAIVNITDTVTPVDRNNFRRVQTPFCARQEILQNAYKNAQSAFYDDISVVKTCYSGKIGVVDGDIKNIKITYEGDITCEPLSAVLVGCGYDIHRLTAGDGIKLLGVKVPCDYSFIAHSDGDVPIHAIMDAILSALGEKDIGHLFPVDDSRYDGADSMELLLKVLRIAQERSYRVNNVSVAIIAERPMLSPYIDEMRKTMSTLLGVSISNIGVSATTNEQVGDIGDGKAIAAYATVSLHKK